MYKTRHNPIGRILYALRLVYVYLGVLLFLLLKKIPIILISLSPVETCGYIAVVYKNSSKCVIELLNKLS